jgi:predicted kinase
MSFYIIIRGPLGCGKSTIAKALAKRLNAKYISVDKTLKRYGLENDWEDGYISQKSFKLANDIIVSGALKALESGKPAIFDGNFYWKSQIKDLVKKINFQHQVFTLKAPLLVCIARDNNRKKPHGKDAAYAVHKKSTEFDEGISIDVNKPLNECVKEILSYLSNSAGL